MATQRDVNDTQSLVRKTLETTIRVGLVLSLGLLCFYILSPFLAPMLWGVILAISVMPLFEKVSKVFGGKTTLTTIVMTSLTLACLIVPTFILLKSLVGSIQSLAMQMAEGQLDIPAPPDNIKVWPIVGPKLYRYWSLGSENLSGLLRQIEPQILTVKDWALNSVGSVMVAFFQFIFAVVIAGILLPKSDASRKLSVKFFNRLDKHLGEKFVTLTIKTVRGVAQGVIGVAALQAILGGLGMLLAGVPYAGLWALGILFTATVQLPTLIVLVPAAIYVFSTASTLVAVIFVVFCLIVSLGDNVLRPIMIGKNLDTPNLIIFLGTLGGVMFMGIVGLFTGPVILSVGYRLFVAWLNETKQVLEEPAQVMDLDDDERREAA